VRPPRRELAALEAVEGGDPRVQKGGPVGAGHGLERGLDGLGW
jgi:hypothetical protein